RRAALGLLRIVIEGRLHLNLVECIERAAFWLQSDIPRQASARLATGQLLERGQQLVATGYSPVNVSLESKQQLLDFLYARLRGLLRDQGFDPNPVASVVDGKPPFIDDIPLRLQAVRTFEALPEAAALATANKRIVNILRKSGSDAATAVDRSLLSAG